MARKGLIYLGLALVAWLGPAGSARAQKIPKHQQVIDTASLACDLNKLLHWWQRHHANLYLYSTPQQVDSAFRQLRQTLRPMTAFEFYQHLSPLNAVIGDGHTFFMPPFRWMQHLRKEVGTFPLEVAAAGDTLVVTDTVEGGRYTGAQLLRINGTPSSEVFKIMQQHVGRDGVNETFPAWVAQRYFSMIYAFAFGDTNKFVVEFMRRDSTWTDTLAAEVRKSAKKRADKEPGLWLSESDGLAVLTISTWNANQMRQLHGQNLKKELETVMTELKASKADHLVVDLRGNQGGHTKYGEQLLSHLVDHPFYYMRDVQRVEKGGEQRLKSVSKRIGAAHSPVSNPFMGRVSVLVDGGSFSNSAIFCEALRRARLATIVGTEAGGNGHVLTGVFLFWSSFSLAHSGVTVNKANHRIVATSLDENTGRGVKPDLHIKPTARHVLGEVDLWMEAVRRR